MMDDSKKRFQIGFIGSLGFHLFVFLVLAFAGLFAANHVDDKIVEIAVFGGGGGARHRGGGHRGGEAPLPAVRQTAADVAAAQRGHPLDIVGKIAGLFGGITKCDRFPPVRRGMLIAADRGADTLVRTQTEKERTSMQKTSNLQEVFLTKARKENVPVTVFLVNGFQLRGVITGFDCFVVVLDSEGRQQVIYKHAISTIAPARSIGLREETE